MTTTVLILVALDSFAWSYALLASAIATTGAAFELAPFVAVVAIVSVGLPLFLETKRYSHAALAIAAGSLVLCLGVCSFGLDHPHRYAAWETAAAIWMGE